MFFHMVSKAQSDLAPSTSLGYPTCLLGSLFNWGCRKILWCFLVLAMLSVGISPWTFSHSSYAKNVSDLPVFLWSTCAPLSEVKMTSLKSKSNQVLLPSVKLSCIFLPSSQSQDLDLDFKGSLHPALSHLPSLLQL